MEQDQEFVEYIVKALVDHPEDVKTTRTVDEMGVLITLFINPQDMGTVIGRMGQTAKAVRTLLRVVGAKHKARVNLKTNRKAATAARATAVCTTTAWSTRRRSTASPPKTPWTTSSFNFSASVT